AMLLRLQRSAADLEKALTMQRQFVADASHELRTPLTSLLGNVDFLTLRCLEDCPLPAVEQHQEVLRDLGSETRRMTHMVNDLLLLARADAQQHLTLLPVELEPILQTAYRQARGLSDAVRVQLVAQCAGIQVMADSDRLLQLVLILLDNAV